MPEPDHVIRLGDQGVSIPGTLTDDDDIPVNITGASVAFHVAPLAGGSALTLGSTATITNATAGAVSYTWQDGDIDTPGWYAAHWKVHYAGGALQSFPNGYPIVILATPEVGSLT